MNMFVIICGRRIGVGGFWRKRYLVTGFGEV